MTKVFNSSITDLLDARGENLTYEEETRYTTDEQILETETIQRLKHWSTER